MIKLSTQKLYVSAFTLAEVLITLGIIGVVAAITIPTLMNKTQDAEFKNAMKKQYSGLSQAYQQLKMDNDGDFVSAISACSNSVDLKNLFKTKFISSKDCDSDSTSPGACFPAQAKVKWLNGNSASSWYFNNDSTSGLILSDGTTFAFYLESPTCAMNNSPNYSNRCGWLTVDVNGLKPPNTWGKDIYLFFIFYDAIRPSIGGSTDSVVSTDDCGTGTNKGYTCSSKYLLGN